MMNWEDRVCHLLIYAGDFPQDVLKTRLLGRPQPQMYPPVALNQYILVKRTHQIFVFILGGPGEAYVESRGIKVS